MKISNLILFFIFVLSTGKVIAQSGLSRTTSVYNEEGQLQMTIVYRPDCSCRVYTEFYPNGKVYAQRTFKVNKKKEFVDGEDITYYADGKVKDFRFWKDALPEGKAYSNYPDGRTEHEAYFHNGYKSGTWKYFNKKGELTREHIYEPGKTRWDSKAENVVVKFYEDGKLKTINTYRNGKKIDSQNKGESADTPAPQKKH